MDIEKKLAKWSDEKVLEVLYAFLEDRVQVTNKLLQNEDGFVTHQMIIFQCGDKFFTGEPQELIQPLEPLPIPDGLDKRKIN